MSNLLLIAAVLELAVVVHLAHTGLWRRFRFFGCYMVAVSLWTVTSSFLPVSSPAFAVVWKIGATAWAVTALAAFLEMMRLSLEHYPGSSTKIVLAAFGVIAAISAVLSANEPTGQFVQVLLVIHRVLGVAIAVGGTLMVAVLNYMDPARRPNIIRHERLMAAMPMVTAIAAWLSNHGYRQPGAFLLHAGNLTFPLLWIWALRPTGEIDPRPPADPRGEDEAKRAKNELQRYFD